MVGELNSASDHKAKKNKRPAKKAAVVTSNETPKSKIAKKLIPEVVGDPPITSLEREFNMLNNRALVKKFMGVEMTNNQKGRIRQKLKECLKGSADAMYPEIISNKIQSILDTTTSLTEADLRKIRILFNMLTVHVTRLTSKDMVATTPKNSEIKDKDSKKKLPIKKKELKEVEDKPIPLKRYVVFIGNLPLDIKKHQIMSHFGDVSTRIKDVRIPKPKEGRKSGIAYLELSDGIGYEMALSKHHTMLDNRRINVLYSTHRNSKLSAAEVKAKSAKLIALQKTGKLVGSVPLTKKRSQRRKKKNEAEAAAKKN